MVILGAHMSIAGGYYKAVNAAAEFDMQCVQVFTKNNNQWRAKPIETEDVEKFQTALQETGVGYPVSHASYLINMASPKTELWEKSRDAMLVELERADQLGIPYVVVHPGSFVSSSETEGLAKIAKALNEIHAQAPHLKAQALLETTAGQGTNLGHRFEHLATILEQLDTPENVGICLDTCHLFAAGYALAPKKDFNATMRDFNQLVGIDKLKAIHLNDSKKPQGSRVDRHEHIGQGYIGEEAFQILLQDRRFKKIPMYLETPKGNPKEELFDPMNLATLRRLETA